jgi:glycosyltransferase involved in cell wall biosynthesis
MKIALCSSFVPFIRGGYRNIVEWLELELIKKGHNVERIYLPHIDVPDLLLTQLSAYRWIDLTNTADRIICFRPPAHVIVHPHKVLWFTHHIRVFYDLWDSPYRGFPVDEKHIHIRDILHQTDTAAITEARKVFTNSQIVANRLLHFNGICSEVLYPPIFDPDRFNFAGLNDEVVYLCRVEHHKRQHLLVEAMRYTRTAVKLRICGTGSESYCNDLSEQIKNYKLDSKVRFENAWISEEEKQVALSQCLAAAYLPLDEDSYGYPSLEASHAQKPVLTTTDSGGVLELVKHQVNGLIADPTPEALAEAMDRLYTDRISTKLMGQNALARIGDLKISWTHVLDRLLA